MPVRTILIVPLSACAYTTLYRRLEQNLKTASPSSFRALNRAISASHAGLMTILVLYTLRPSKWRAPSPQVAPRKDSSDGNFDDSSNLLISGSSQLANDLSAWETGYLFYDTYMLLRLAQHASSTPIPLRTAIARAARASPAIFGHHVALVAALVTLQMYIARGRERGMWVILAFFVMNASNPLMHAVWFARKAGRDTRNLEVIFAVVFAASRFGLVWYILRKYGQHHGIGPTEAYAKLRIPCKLGTAALVGLNGVWWITLIKNILMRKAAK